MRVIFEDRTDISEILKFNIGIKPSYGKRTSTMQGVVWCSCNKCVGDVLLLPNGKVVGWIDTKCRCGNQIDWSEADKYL